MYSIDIDEPDTLEGIVQQIMFDIEGTGFNILLKGSKLHWDIKENK